MSEPQYRVDMPSCLNVCCGIPISDEDQFIVCHGIGLSIPIPTSDGVTTIGIDGWVGQICIESENGKRTLKWFCLTKPRGCDG